MTKISVKASVGLFRFEDGFVWPCWRVRGKSRREGGQCGNVSCRSDVCSRGACPSPHAFRAVWVTRTTHKVEECFALGWGGDSGKHDVVVGELGSVTNFVRVTVLVTL